MIGQTYILKLVLVVCMNSDCSIENAYEVDNFKGAEYGDVIEDCRTARDNGNREYSAIPGIGARLHCWTPSELAKMGFN